jgi:hypothetical protein
VRPEEATAPAANRPGGPVNHILYRRYGPPPFNGDITRVSGIELISKWVDANNKPGSSNWRSTVESGSEVVLYDALRDLYLR